MVWGSRFPRNSGRKIALAQLSIPISRRCFLRAVSHSLSRKCKTNISEIPPPSMQLLPFSLRCLQRCFSTETQRGLNAIKLEHLSPEVVLSEKNRNSFVERFKAHKTPKINESTSHAAVLVPLCTYKGELGFLYTLRSTKVTTSRRQVSFPGGMYDNEDRNLQECALRETWEELKIPKEKVDVWASGNMIDKKNLKVLPVFGYVGEIDPEKLQINTHEVEEAFFHSLKYLCDRSLCGHTQFRNGYTLPVYMGGKHRIWGFTAAITHIILNALVPDAYKHKLVYLSAISPERISNNLSRT